MKRNTPDADSKLSPAEIIMGQMLSNALPSLPKSMMIMNSPVVNQLWGEMWGLKEKCLRDKYLRHVQGNSPEKLLPPL